MKALRNKLEQEVTVKDSDAVYSQVLRKADSALVTGVAKSSVVDLQYLFDDGTESSV